MKLLSMNREGKNCAGVLIGDEVLDLSRWCALEGVRQPDGPPLPWADALDLSACDPSWLEHTVSMFENDPSSADRYRANQVLLSLSGVTLNPPVLHPGKILAVGLNYAQHAAEQNAKLPETPLIFTKNTTAITGPEQQIRLPRISQLVDYEAELAVVIGKRATSVSADRALEYVAGYTIMNDVTARDLQRRERQWARAKGLDTFAPCGPWIVTTEEITDPHALDIQLRVNGELRQDSNTSDLIFKVPELIEFISQDLTLLPGDIISTGTPSGVGFARLPSFSKRATSSRSRSSASACCETQSPCPSLEPGPIWHSPQFSWRISRCPRVWTFRSAQDSNQWFNPSEIASRESGLASAVFAVRSILTSVTAGGNVSLIDRGTRIRGFAMKIRSVKHNNRKKAFEMRTSNRTLQFPYSKLDPQPCAGDPLRRVCVDKELGSEGFTYVLKSGKNGTVHIEQVLEYNRDPWYLRDALLYKLTVEAQKRLEKSPLSKREIIRRLGTSAAQFYRLLDQKNDRTSIDQLLSLLHVLDCEVDLVIRAKTAASGKAA